MKELLEIVKELNNGALGWGALVILMLSLIQIAPIKINPWSAIIKRLGKALTEESCKLMAGQMNQLDEALNEIEQSVRALEFKVVESELKADEDRAITARVRILRFNDEVLSDKRHSKESFDQTLEDIDNYEKYCLEHPEFRNNKTLMSIKNIKIIYQRQLATHDFLINGDGEE